MPGSSDFSSGARHQAQEILSKPPYRTTPSHTPRPLEGVFHEIGRGLAWAFGHPARWVYRHVFRSIGHDFTGAFGVAWPFVLGALTVGVGALVAVLLVRRRTRVSAKEAGSARRRDAVEDPDDLEARATIAENSGDHETAVRLRFRAGLLRLARHGILVDYNAKTDRQLSARLGSPTFVSLARRHESIVYGRDPATVSDVATARDKWPRVLAEVPAVGHEPSDISPPPDRLTSRDVVPTESSQWQ